MIGFTLSKWPHLNRTSLITGVSFFDSETPFLKFEYWIAILHCVTSSSTPRLIQTNKFARQKIWPIFYTTTHLQKTNNLWQKNRSGFLWTITQINPLRILLVNNVVFDFLFDWRLHRRPTRVSMYMYLEMRDKLHYVINNL